jgi:soluble lytic murein transglycosylase
MGNMRQLLANRCFIFCFAMCVAATNYAAVGDINVLKAREAFDKEKASVLAEYVKQLQKEQHILAPYAQYWLITLQLEETDNADISAFLAQHEDYGFAQRLRGNFLRKLGKHKDWALFTQERSHYQSTQNTAVECLATEAQHEQSGGDLTAAKYLWMSEKDQPSDCDALFDMMQTAGVIDEEAVWQRFRMATGGNGLGLAQSIIKRSNDYQASQQKILASANKSPEQFLKNSLASFKTKFGREVNLFALIQLSKQDTWQAINAYKKLANQFNHDEESYFYTMLGLFSAKRHESEAQTLFQKADVTTLNSEQISWYARAALRTSNWPHVLSIITEMKPEVAEEARWRYWKARALIALNKDDQQAVDLLTKLGSERHYYGWLAQDELKNYTPPTLLHYQPTKNEIAAIGALEGVKRAKALLDLDLRWEGKLEWEKVIKPFDDKKLLAAANFAKQQAWYDLAINTADDTREMHDFSMRYLMPYQTLMVKAAHVQGIDETWVHGIARQESRFMHYAKSHVGAAGVMQLMPTTARWAAKRAGVNNYKRSMIHDLDTNITIGTYYLSHTLALMNGNKVMATAGYNAGPSRAKKWLSTDTLEGPIYAETIPFDETRVYVQRVMANMLMYKKQLGITGLTLKKLMGSTPAKSAS